MWNPLIDIEEDDGTAAAAGREAGFWHTMKKYKSLIYIFIAIFVVYTVAIIYYETSERRLEKDIDCNILNEECKEFKYINFIPDRLSVVDVNFNNNNFIMRSNVPMFDGRFVEKTLMDEIKNRIKESNLNYTDNYSLHIISLLNNNENEKCYVANETCNSRNALIERKQIKGSLTDPYDLPKEEMLVKLKDMTWNEDDLLNIIQDLYNKFMNMKNAIFLIHCREGKDRTGEFVGAYRLIIKRNTLKRVLDTNASFGHLLARFIQMQKWLCLYLEQVLNYTELECYDYRVE